MRTEVEGTRVVDLDELAETGEVTKVGGEIRRQEPLQLLFPHGSWPMRRDKSSWVMVHTLPYNALYDP